MKKTANPRFRVNLLSKLITYALFGSVAVSLAYAEEKLDEIQVVGKNSGESSKAQRSLTTTVKTAEQLKKEQVADIRELTRYDPGISVNEQGTGASAGYSIRGVDRDRVAITVDGIPQSQNYAPSSDYAERFSGAKMKSNLKILRALKSAKGQTRCCPAAARSAAR
ncbi:TonB-dependent receptor plug domain-containing protein [Testudinibacter sp. P27/CKL/0425]